MMKRAAALLAAVVMAAAFFTGCGSKDETTTEAESTSAAETTEAAETTTEAETKPAAVEGTVTAALNFRQEPGTDAAILEVIPDGASVTVLEAGSEWFRISYNGREGYVSAEFVSIGEAESKVGETTTAEAVTTTPDTTAAPSGNGGVLTDRGLFDLTGLSNKSIPYGNDWDDKDANGIPNGIHYYESLYSKYYSVYRINTQDKTLYITMDEGYEAGYTPAILDTLKEKNVKVVFFLTKQFVDSDPELVQRMIDEGHILGNHSCAHPAGGFPKYVDEKGLQAFTDDIARLHQMVYDQFGYEMKLFRFPEGEASELTMAQLANIGYTPVFWSYAHRDYVLDDQPDPSVTLQRCLDHMAPGSVYLLHAVSSSNTAALGAFIDQARAAGYEFGVFPVNEVTAH